MFFIHSFFTRIFPSRSLKSTVFFCLIVHFHKHEHFQTVYTTFTCSGFSPFFTRRTSLCSWYVKIPFVSTNQIINTVLCIYLYVCKRVAEWMCGALHFRAFWPCDGFNSTESATSQHAYKNSINFHLSVSYIN